MEYSKKIDFNGGYVELFVPLPPIYELGRWELKVIGKIISSSEITKSEGEKILFNKGFTTNGNKNNEYYRTIEVLVDL